MKRIDQTAYKLFRELINKGLFTNTHDVLEDFVLNNKKLRKFNKSIQTIICGLILFYRNIDLGPNMNHFNIFVDKCYVLGISPRDAILKYYSRFYKWDGHEYYKYNFETNLWVKCDFEPLPLGTNLIKDISMFGLTSKIWEYGRSAITSYLDKIRSCEIDVSDIVQSIQSKITIFDDQPNRIYTKEKFYDIINFTEGKIKRKDRITSTLDCQPTNDKKSDTISKYFRSLRTSRQELKSHILSMGIPSTNITIIYGPPGSGKTSLYQIIRNLFAGRPVPTIYYDDNEGSPMKILDLVKDHSDCQIVYTTTSDIEYDFGDRNVTKIELVGPVKTPDVDIVSKMNTFDNRSDLVQSCLKALNKQNTSPSTDSFSDLFMKYLLLRALS